MRAGLRVDSVEGVVAVLMDGRRSDEVGDSMGGWMVGEEVGGLVVLLLVGEREAT